MSSSPQRAQSGTEVTGVNQVTHAIIGAAMKVHSALGPGLLESAYEACLVHELRKAGFRVAQQAELPVIYDGVRIDLGYRLDLIVNDCVIVELKCVEKIAAVHEAQLISYMKLSKKNVGLLINFHVRHLKDGIKRFVEGTDWN
ncbi:MAG TPA: GxxExxY protein [Candidatus Angelobacter sp.]|jgi:GxxExxY protein|nr:GxxExxY protein [Candidatus Angelobacter sp.]